ncbi:MAG: hypothetical protein NVS3B12_04900 [Acidimicrobiales bacterium]
MTDVMVVGEGIDRSESSAPIDALPVAVAPRWHLLGTWVAAALLLGGLLALSRSGYRGLDDPNQAFQRPGLLDIGSLPDHPPAVTPSLPRTGRRAVVFFTRARGLAPLELALSGSDLRRMADVAIVDEATVPAPPGAHTVAVVAEAGDGLARSYGMRVPRDGGPPVGYAIVDRNGRVRYATIDPGDAHRLQEVRTMLSAVP